MNGYLVLVGMGLLEALAIGVLVYLLKVAKENARLWKDSRDSMERDRDGALSSKAVLAAESNAEKKRLNAVVAELRGTIARQGKVLDERGIRDPALLVDRFNAAGVSSPEGPASDRGDDD